MVTEVTWPCGKPTRAGLLIAVPVPEGASTPYAAWVSMRDGRTRATRGCDLRTCARRGHETYAPTGPAEQALRGRLHVGTLLLLAAGAAVIGFKDSQASLSDYFETHFTSWQNAASQLNYDLGGSGIVRQIRHVLHLGSTTLLWVAVGLFAYAVLQLLEGVGLWLLKRWGEYVAVVGTGGFVPLEVYEVFERLTWVRLGALVVNVAAVVYLVVTKRLFGVRGGQAAFRAERHGESLLEVERAAALVPRQPAATEVMAAGAESRTAPAQP